MKRWNTRPVKIANLTMGGQNKVLIQSMTTTKTKDTQTTIAQILDLEKRGCELIRVAILDQEDAEAIKAIKEEIHIPLIADIHFDYRLALLAIENGADKIRINPGNMQVEHLKLIVDACKNKKIPIRIGVNSGSLPSSVSDYKDQALALVSSAKDSVKRLEELDFYDIVISLKSSDVLTTIRAYELAAETFPYPLHLGITEAGDCFTSCLRSGAGLGILLKEGIGDTIRISMNAEPKMEISACKELLKAFNLYENYPTLIACPTCGRCQIDLMPIVQEVKAYLDELNKNIKVAVMGCVVNGPGEAKEADIGIAGGLGQAALFKKGKIIKKIDEKDIVRVLKEEIEKM
jgi:(E)-4-hydroxy-3-methylbut-2-enyl-diphosphate synthase